MENITMTNMTQIDRVRFACPQIADHTLTDIAVRDMAVRTVGVDGTYQGTGVSSFGLGSTGGFGSDLQISAATPVPTFHAPMNKALAVKDVAFLRSWSPPV